MPVFHNHDIFLTLFAAAICVTTAVSTYIVLRSGLRTRSEARSRRIDAAAIVAGTGIWATHFVAMLGYETHGEMRFLALPTAFSLLAGLAGLYFSFRPLRRGATRGRAALAGAGTGLSTTALHYIGMAAVVFPAEVSWNPWLIALSVVSGTAFAVAAFCVMLGGRDNLARGAGGVTLLTLSVVALHYIGMAAMQMGSHQVVATEGFAVSHNHMGALVGGLTLAMLGWATAHALVTRRRDRAQAAREREFALLMEGVRDTAIYMLDPDGNVMSWNTGAQRLKGYSADEIRGQHFGRFYSEQDRLAGAPARALETARTTGLFRADGLRYRKDGTSFWASVTIEPIYEDDGSLHGFAKVTRDISALKEAEQRLDAALDNMQQGLLMLDAERRLVMWNSQMHRLYSIPDGGLRAGMSFREILAATLGRRLSPAEWEAGLRDGEEFYGQLLDDPEGSNVVVELDDARVFSVSSRPMREGGWVATIEDITDRHRSAERLEFMARHDPLTGLPNLASFRELLSDQLDVAARRDQQFAVAIIDLDGFKEVNDRHGHGAGDELLGHVATRLSSAMEGIGTAARLGGDEFAVIAPLDDERECDKLGELLAETVDTEFMAAGASLKVSGSIGIAAYPADGEDPKMLSGNADLAMYRAKSDATLRWCRFKPEMDREVRDHRELQSDLRRALEEEQFELFYQVQCSVSSGEICGYEALIRWNHPERGYVSPDKFIPVAEENGLIVPIGKWVLRTACATAAKWEQPHKIAVNISAIQLGDPDLPSLVSTVLMETGLPPSRLEIEITETAIISDKLRALHCLRRIKAMGVSVAIDDFGTGYSSLDTLNSFAFDKIKIDRAFLTDSHRNPNSRAIIRAVLALGRSLNLPVLAEGVETAEQLELLKAENCTEAQGYFLGRPAPVAEGEVLMVDAR